MKIQDASILMTSAKTFQTQYEEKEQVRIWVAPQNRGSSEDRVVISRQSRTCSAGSGAATRDTLADDFAKYRVTLEVLLAEILAGRKVKILDISQFEKGSIRSEVPEKGGETDHVPSASRGRWGMHYSHQSSYCEDETLGFFAAGIIRTADGKDIDFALRLDMHREYMAAHSLNLRAGDATLMDPLVLNFDGKASQLGNATFTFDLDADGTEEHLPTLGPGSGFLVLDLNQDGMVNNGNELFGPSTGRGFAELSRYDADGNDWIDEADPVYDRLSVWTMDHQGNHTLNTLEDKGVGAIYLRNVTARFDLKGSDNVLKGKVRNMGVFLDENGNAGSIQQLDLAV